MARDGTGHGGGRDDPEPQSNASQRLADIAKSKTLADARDRLEREQSK